MEANAHHVPETGLATMVVRHRWLLSALTSARSGASAVCEVRAAL